MKRRYKVLNTFLGLIGIAIITLMITLSYTSDCPPATAESSAENTYKTFVQYCYGGPETLQLEVVEKPQPADNEVLVKVHAAGVNPLDYHTMRGSPYVMRLGSGIGKPERQLMGADFAGVVESVGKNVTRFKPGDEVFGGTRGAFSEYLTIREDKGIVLKPSNVTFEEAAGVAVAAVTALQAVRDHGGLKAGEKVLINGASGGVGTFAVQIAKSMGAEVHGVCSTRNIEMVQSIGADRVFDYKKEDYTESGEEFDLIVDMVGNHSISSNRDVLKSTGRYVAVGGAKGNWLAPLMTPLAAVIQDSFVDQELKFFVAEFKQKDFEFLAELMASQQMTPVIDRYYPLDEVPQAIAYSESGRARGKIIIQIQ